MMRWNKTSRLSRIQACARIMGVMLLVVQFHLCFCQMAKADNAIGGAASEEGVSCHVDLDRRPSTEPQANELDCCCSSSENYLQDAKALPYIPIAAMDFQFQAAGPSVSLVVSAPLPALDFLKSSDPPLALQSAPFLSLRI